jgi:large subunit ribosomal protein L5
MNIELKRDYQERIVPELKKQFNYTNVHQIPKLIKINVSCGLGLNGQNNTFLQKSIDELRIITGQQPITTVAKKSIAGFKVRKDMPLGLKTTLRRRKMYAFLTRLIHLVLPRIRDFRGLPTTGFDKYGNYSLGLSEQLVFPEINYDDVDQKRGFNITIVTTAKTPEESFLLLQELGVPFKNKSIKS